MARTVQLIVVGGSVLLFASTGCDDAREPAPSAEQAEVSVSAPTTSNELPDLAYAVAVEDMRGELLDRTRELDRNRDAFEPTHETEEDWAILRSVVEWARTEGLEDRSAGEIMAVVGATFVGTPYVPHTLEVPGPEELVVNLRALDCVTFVENLLAVAHLLQDLPEDLLDDEEAFRSRYREILTSIRYRGGVLDGYPSRLHYFSEWVTDGERKGFLRDRTEALGGAPDTRPVHFMTSNPEAYPPLVEDPEMLAAMEEIEEGLNQVPRFRIPQDRIQEVEERIADGDIIATTSTVDGLDVAHTGIAVWKDGRVHLLHAPLVGESVEISERPLAERIQALRGQDGILVVRPADQRGPGVEG